MDTFIELFAGIGGFRLGLEPHGLKCAFASEIDHKTQEIYQQNHNHKPAGDITQIPADQIPPHDILTAGFPCQSFSLAGNRTGFSDPRGNLFFEIARVAKHHQPKVLILENVRGLLTTPDAVNTIKHTLDLINYETHVSTLNSSLYGIPQSRHRVYIVALHRKANLKYLPPPPLRIHCSLKNYLLPNEDCPETFVNDPKILIFQTNEPPANRPIRVGVIGKGKQGDRIYSDKGHAVTQQAKAGGRGTKSGLYLVRSQGRHYDIFSEEGHAITQLAGKRTSSQHKSGLYLTKSDRNTSIYSTKGHAITQTANTNSAANKGGIYLANTQVRKLHITEVKRVMGFPDNFIVSPKEKGKQQLGNAVIPKMISLIYQEIKPKNGRRKVK